MGRGGQGQRTNGWRKQLLLDSIGTLRIAREYITISTPETEPTSPAPKGMTTAATLLFARGSSKDKDHSITPLCRLRI